MSVGVAIVSSMRFDSVMAALVEFAASRHNAFHTTEAADMSIPPQRLSRAAGEGILTHLHPRVWGFASLGKPPGQATRAATLARRAAAACHLSSTWLHEWDSAPPASPQILVPGSARAPTAVSLHRAKGVDPRTDVCEVNGIRTLNRAATLCLLGRVVSRRDLSWYLDQFCQTNSTRWLTDTLDRIWSPTDAGPVALAALLEDSRRITDVTESWLERVVADLLTMADLPRLEAQYPIEVAGRRFRLDLAMPSIKLGIEAHGRTFHRGAAKHDADNVRDLLVSTQGWQLLYVTRSQLADPARFVATVAEIARIRSRQLERPAA